MSTEHAFAFPHSAPWQFTAREPKQGNIIEVVPRHSDSWPRSDFIPGASPEAMWLAAAFRLFRFRPSRRPAETPPSFAPADQRTGAGIAAAVGGQLAFNAGGRSRNSDR
jgi:hypothetical protein